jgi:Protein of unknown function (DUF3303)
MKYLVEWKVRGGGSSQENLTSAKRALEVLGKWTPSTTVHQFLSRVDAAGGFAVMECDDPADLARDCAIFSPFLELSVYPVLDIEQGTAVQQAAIEFNDSI